MNKKFLLTLASCAVFMMSCEKGEEVGGGASGWNNSEPGRVVIDPVITKATAVNFEAGDKISVSIVKADSSVHVSNACLTYVDSLQAFTSELKWYEDGSQTCTVRAFYPYQESGIPSSFSVAADQSAGTGSSDAMYAWKTGVRPSENAVTSVFKHIMSQVEVVVDNQAQATLSAVVIKGVFPTASIEYNSNGSVKVAADTTAEKINVSLKEITTSAKYRGIIVPQKATFTVGVEVNGTTLISGIPETEILSGYTYRINVQVLADQVNTSLSGDIENWGDGGEIGGTTIPGEKDDTPEDGEDAQNKTVTYAGETYHYVTMKDGRDWFAENLRYVPEGKVVNAAADSTHTEAGDGIFYPALFTVSNGVASITPTNDPEVVKAQGLLYTAAAAFKGAALPTTDWTDAEDPQGICPDGWHIPTAKEWVDLVGACSNGAKTNTSAPYYNSGLNGADLAALNEDGFNLLPYPALLFVSKAGVYAYNWKLLNNREDSPYNTYTSMGYFLASTGRSATQSYACMVGNVAAKSYVNCSYSFLTNALPVRCIRNK